MRKTNPSPKQSNTLLNYFNKSQSQTNSSNNSPKNLKSDEFNANKSKSDSKNNGSVASTSKQTNLNKTNDENIEIDYELYDIVWAKLEGYVY